MNKRFPVLSSVALILRIIGWCAVVAGVIYIIIYAVVEPSQEGHHFGAGNFFNILGGGAAAVLGLTVVAFGEAIGVLFAIEENTRTHRAVPLAAVLLASTFCFLRVGVARGDVDEVPPINDITTDTANPPIFLWLGNGAAPLATGPGRDMRYPGEESARQQRAFYGDKIAPLVLASPPDETFKRVAALARTMNGWIIAREDPTARAIEGYDTNAHPVDDFVIEVRKDGNGRSVVEMRSKSRGPQGEGDGGSNARRIRSFLAQLHE